MNEMTLPRGTTTSPSRPDAIAARPEPAPAIPKRVETPRAQGRARLLLALGIFLLGLWTIHAFMPALVWAAILAIAAWPLFARAERRWPPGPHNIVLPALFTAGVGLVFLVPLALAGIQLAREAHVMIGMAEDARLHGIPVPDWLGRIPGAGSAAAAWWSENLAQPSGSTALIERLNRGSLVGYTRTLGGQLVHRSVIFGFTLLTLFFLFRDGRTLMDQMRSAGQRAFGPHGERIARQMIASVHGTVDGLVLVGLGEGFLIGISYWIAGVPHPTLFGAATAIAAMIPFGAPIVFGIAALLVLAAGKVGAAIGIVAFGFVVTFVADHFVRPVLIGGATKLPFIWVLLGILGGVETWGLLGLFLGPALLAALVLLWRDWSGTPVETAPPKPETA